MKLIFLASYIIFCDALFLRNSYNSLVEKFNDVKYKDIDSEINKLKSILDYENNYSYKEKLITKCFRQNILEQNPFHNFVPIDIENIEKSYEGQYIVFNKEFNILDNNIYHEIMQFVKNNNLQTQLQYLQCNDNNINNKIIICEIPCYKLNQNKDKEILNNKKLDEYQIKENLLNMLIENKILYNKFMEIKNNYGDKKDIQKAIIQKLKKLL